MNGEDIPVFLGEYKGLRLNPIFIALPDEVVASRMIELLERVAKEEQVDGPIRIGDVVAFTYEGRVGGKPYAGLSGNVRSLKVGSGDFIAGFEERLLGHRVHDEFDFKINFPPRHINNELCGRLARFHVKITGVSRKRRSLLEDDFVRDVSEFDSVEEFRQAVAVQMEAENADEMRRHLRFVAKEAVLSCAQVTVPRDSVIARVQENVEEMDEVLRQQGSSLEEHLRQQGKTREEFMSEMGAEVEKGMACSRILLEIARRENVTIADEDVKREIEQLALSAGVPASQVEEALSNPGFANDLHTSILQDKALAIVIENAVISEGEVDENAL